MFRFKNGFEKYVPVKYGNKLKHLCQFGIRNKLKDSFQKNN